MLQGSECEERFQIILGLTSIRSVPMIAALHRHYVDGVAEELLMVDAANFNRAKTTLGECAAEIEKVKVLDWVNHGNR